jgi:hypothetical protein
VDDRVALFLHVPKTAGTTFTNCIYNNYADATPLAEEDELLAEGVYYYLGGFLAAENGPSPDALRAFARPDLRAVVGHFRFGIHVHVPTPSTYLTILRGPVERTNSVYRHVQRFEHSEFHAEVVGGRLTIDEFVSDLGFLEVDNGQTRRVSGIRAAFGRCTASMLDAAKENLDQHFSVVGVQERFDEFLLVVQRALGWTDVHHVPQLVDEGRRSAAPLSDSSRECILERNELDVELHAYATKKLDEQLAAQR